MYLKLMKAVVHFDGGCRPNPGLGSYGYKVDICKTKDIYKNGGLIGHATSNIAEYCGLISALRKCLSLGVTNVTIYGDSKLVIQQVYRRWKTKNKKLKVLRVVVMKLLGQFNGWKMKWVPREHNSHADSIAEEARHKEDSKS